MIDTVPSHIFGEGTIFIFVFTSLLSKTGEKIATRVANGSFARAELHF
jgi:hypothetical protein